MSFLHIFLIIASTVLNITAAASITTLPTPRNSTLHSNVSFECATNGGPLYWIINGTDHIARWNNGITFKTRQESGTEYTSTLCIRATAANNNTQVQCGVFDITSPPVLLLIQGKLSPPRNVKVNFTTYSQIDLIWKEPPTLDMIRDNEMGIHGLYLVTIVNLNNGIERVFNTTRNRYTFIREDYEHCDVFRFQVVGYNEAGMGYQSEEIEAAFLGSSIITSPANVSTSRLTDESAIFRCSLLCDELNVVTWFIDNEIVTKLNPSSYRTSSDYPDCSSGALNYTETLEINIPSFIASGHDINDVVTIYCSVLNGLTDKIEYDQRNREVTQCYSRDAYLTVVIPEMNLSTSQSEMTLSPGTSPLILINTTRTSPDIERNPQRSTGPEETSSEKNQLLLGICIGLAAILILFVLISIGALVCMLAKKTQENKRQGKTKSEDPVYAIPFSAQTAKSDENKSSSSRAVETGVNDVEVIYDQPKTPSPQPDMQPCAAYRTTRRHNH